MVIKNLQRIRQSIVSSVYYRAHHGWARKKFQNRSSQMAGKRCFEFGFCKQQSHFFIFYTEFTASVLNFLSYPESLRRLKNVIFRLVLQIQYFISKPHY